ncbi:hypothetical protein CIRMBP1277_01630 [Enterococcus cecorum]|nr:hypothetical protein CIRMBP1277_01630 [Enterococcus cecorum]
MKKNKRFIGFVSVLIALIILVPVIGLFVMTSPEKKVEQTMPTSTHVSKVKKNQKPKTTKTSETTPAVVKEAQLQSTVDTPTNNQTTTTSSTTTVNQGQNDSNQNNQAMPSTQTPSATPKFTAQEAIAVAQSYYDRTGLSPSNMHFDIVDTHQVLVGSDGKTYWHVIGSVDGSPYMAYDIAVDNDTIHDGVLYAQGQGNFVPAE